MAGLLKSLVIIAGLQQEQVQGWQKIGFRFLKNKKSGKVKNIFFSFFFNL